MKVMKSYRMDDTILGMIDRLKKEQHYRNDTQVIEMAIIKLVQYYDELKIKAEYHHGK